MSEKESVEYSMAPFGDVSAIEFSIYSPKEIKSQSVMNVKLVSENSQESRLFNYVPDGVTSSTTNVYKLGGLMDQRLGQIDNLDDPGSFGHINLAKPVYHLSLIITVVNILKCIGYYSHKLLIDKEDEKYCMEVRDSERLRRVESIALQRTHDNYYGNKYLQPKYSIKGMEIFISFDRQEDSKVQKEDSEDSEDLEDSEESENLPILYKAYEVGTRPFLAEEALHIFKNLSDSDIILLGLNPYKTRPEYLIIQVLPLSPPQIRPSLHVSANMKTENDLTHVYSDIVEANNSLNLSIKRGDDQYIINSILTLLTENIARLIDNNNGLMNPGTRPKSGTILDTLTQRISGKNGRIRGNLMGKRVDFTGRTVITADPNLSIDQVGIPISFAKNLTVPEIVTSLNYSKLTSLVQRGPSIHPGARFIKKNSGEILDLLIVPHSGRILSLGDTVERHLDNDDLVLMNRQPTLHKMSMMAHRVRVLPYSTLRLNLSVTTPYNADFDGDEMNMHVPQGIEARTEAETFMVVNKLIVTAQSNRPVMGIVQDALLASSLLTRRNVYITKDVFMSACMQMDNFIGVLPEPAIIGPKDPITDIRQEYYTGKQLFSMVIPKTININLKSIGHPKNEKITDLSPKDTLVIIRSGMLLCGTMDKNILGNKEGSLIHITNNDLGPIQVKNLFNNIQRLVNHWASIYSSTVGVKDIYPGKKISNQVNEVITEYFDNIKKYTEKVQNKQLEIKQGSSIEQMYESYVNETLTRARAEIGAKVDKDLTFDNGIKRTVSAGSKGSNLNIAQIIGCVGQQNVEGQRIGFGFDKRTLPHYTKDDNGPEARGFVKNSYYKGLSPQEFFFHAMGGRVGSIDTAIRTPDTGYIQRRLVKALEDISVKYDTTVRNSNEDIIQFLYGDDGFDAVKVESQRLDFMMLSRDELMRKYSYEDSESASDINELIILQNMLHKITKSRYPFVKYSDTNFNSFNIPVNIERILLNYSVAFPIKKSDMNYSEVRNMIKNLLDKIKTLYKLEDYSNELFRANILSNLAPRIILDEYSFTREIFQNILDEIYHKYSISIVNPGEMCGVIAAQSIGEPATQMTLNSFHAAGMSSKNMTMGVPRLKELLNLSKNISTPTMTVYLNEDYRNNLSKCNDAVSDIEYITLNDIIEKYDISSDGIFSLNLSMNKILMDDKNITNEDVKNALTNTFVDVNVNIEDTENSNIIITMNTDDIELDRLTVISRSFDSINIKGIIGVTKATIVEEISHKYSLERGYMPIKEFILETDGSNFMNILNKEYVDYVRTITNNVTHVASVLGIEAAYKNLFNELRKVISFDGNNINYRHMSLLAEIMCNSGKVLAISRFGVQRNIKSVFARASFEKPGTVITNAAIFGETDYIKGVSENLLLGKLAPVGTGTFELIF